MTVYVGVPMWPFRGMIMCHMFATTNEELEDMARKLGLSESWRQKERDSIGPHYDIAKTKRAWAVRYGAVPCNELHEEVEAFSIVEAARSSRISRRRFRAAR